ncbi:MAG: dehydrogenase E1 component subunit alpha/beta [Flavobacteriales bacterium]|nr:dehydrogenase E1 component subunit alpha/beta [Flavobacteriales bacterium]
MEFKKRSYNNDRLKELYRALLKPRLIEEKMLVLLRQGRISKWFSGIGQEAVSVGAALALESDEFILPMHRNLGVFTSRDIPMQRLFAQFQGKDSGFTHGRDRSFHFGTTEHHIVGMISHLGPQMGIADGIALAHKLKKEKKVSLVFTGDGATSQGDFHEAMNVAAVWDLPVIFVIENNGYGLSTPSNEQFRCTYISDRAKGYGMESVRIDGNNILEVYHTISRTAASMRKSPRPVMVECMTFRMRGHEEASGTKYVPAELMEAWAKKDPVNNYEAYLLKEEILDEVEVDSIRAEIKKEISDALDIAFAADTIQPDTDKELGDVYNQQEIPTIAPSGEVRELRYVDALSEGLRQAMEKHHNLVIMGQDIADYGGVFKVTEGFTERFGKDRVRNTPLCESAIVGAALGLSIHGFKAIMEMQFADFVTCGFNQIINNLAKLHYRWGQYADVVIRMPTGAGVAAGPFHSQSNEAWFTHTPGLKVVYPAFPADAKGLLAASIEDPNPVMFFEHKALYRSITGPVHGEYYTHELGKAATIRSGDEVTIVTYGFGVHWALETLDRHPEISADLIDLRTLVPLDLDAILASVRKTGKAIILHEDSLTGGFGGEIAALINEHAFEDLDAPVVRSASLDTPVPFVSELEWNFLPKARFETQLMALINY